MNTLLKNLLKDNKRILQSLHACIGLDFKKPYYIFDIAAILDKKNNVINMLVEATTAADIASVNKKLDYFHGIEGIFRSFERLENSDKNKEYKSIDNFMNEYNDIYTRLNAI